MRLTPPLQREDRTYLLSMSSVSRGMLLRSGPQKSAPMLSKHLTWVLAIVLCSWLTGCALPRQQSKTPRTAIEQLLLGQAIERSLANVTVPIPNDKPVIVEAVGFAMGTPLLQDNADRTTGVIYASSSDLLFVRHVTSRELGRMGLRIGKGAEVKGYLIRVMVQALGTEQGTVLFGLPALQSILLPVALPEVALYKNQHQRALVRLSLDIYDLGTGRFVHSTPWYEASAFYNEYTVLIIFTFKSTDLQLPP